MTEADLQSLVADGASEGRAIEFKRELNLSTNDHIKKFAATVSAMANSSGGTVFYGIAASEKGRADAIVPLAEFNPDKGLIQLSQVLSDHVQPRLLGIHMEAVPVAGGYVVVLQIPRSFVGAHMVKDDHRFFVRDGARKRPMDVSEIKTAFDLGANTTRMIKEWRLERLAAILAGETPISLVGKAKIVLHIIPIRAFDPSFSVDVKKLFQSGAPMIPVLYSSSMSRGYDYEGVFGYSQSSEGGLGYSYFFFSGAFEGVSSTLLNSGMADGGRTLIPSRAYEEHTNELLHEALKVLKFLNSEPPFFISLSLLNVKGMTMATDYSMLRSATDVRLIKKDSLYLPELFTESWDMDPTLFLLPSYNRIWNASGHSGSRNYKDGKWVER